MMPTSELNKERLQTIASWRAKYSAGHNVVLPAEEAEMMASALLAVMEQEPKYWLSMHRFQSYLKFNKADAERDVAENGGLHIVPLYTAPPALIVPHSVIGWLRADYQEDNRHDEAPLFVLGKNDPSAMWGVTYMPLGNSPVIQDCWISCNERMPEDDDTVLVCQDGGIIFCADVDSGCFYPDEFPNVPKEGREITHWMPLPAAPQQDKSHGQGNVCC
ncbi:DUF551 domain-containing protein [Yokenella regensburgei]|uniref:DUF551 domain-containing protein n=1 Tax=Yokenella regensburgei TaxID=158877 RepID=UPI003EDB340A